MTAVVMKVIKAEKHPFADALRLYEMEAEGIGTKQIVANLENIYEVGDKAVIVLSGSTLKDGTKISSAKIRGIHSYGMALNKSDAEIGTDLSTEYCKEELNASGASMHYWPEIEGLVGVRKGLETLRSNLGESYKLPSVTYKAKIKLHGTNAAVQIHPDGRVFAQSRTSVITPENDNAGFAKWVNDNVDFFKKLVNEEEIVTVFGEWCGSSIQQGTAINKIGKKALAVFALQYGNSDDTSRYYTEPTTIAELLQVPQFTGIDYTPLPDMYVLPWYGEEIVLDFADTEQLRRAAENLNEVVAKVEACDPWVKSVFNVEGIGEGIVLYPLKKDGANVIMRSDYSDLFFKAKGEQHKVVKQKAAVQIDPEVAASVGEFVDMFVTPARLEQAVTTACNGQYDVKLTGAFLKWITADVQKESGAELEASKLDWAKVNKPVMEAARKWYQEKVKAL